MASPIEPKKAKYGNEVVSKRVRVYWPLDQSWYEGRVESFDGACGKHLVRYDDSEEEVLDLSKEKIEWVEEPAVVEGFRRLRRHASSVVVSGEENTEDESGGNDSSDEDWGKNGDEVEEDVSEDMDVEAVDDEDDECGGSKPLQDNKVDSRKRKITGAMSGLIKKSKTIGAGAGAGAGDGDKRVVKEVGGSSLCRLSEPINSAQNCLTSNNFEKSLAGDAAEKFGLREAEKLHFLGKDRRDGKRRRPGDENYDPKTLYLPPDFLKNLSGGQRQWWDFKSKHMDKVLFFKMGKFYELFEMDAHVGARELDLQYMKGDQPHCGFPEKNFSMNVEKLARKGYRILVIEQTETPEQLEIRRKEWGSKDKVVKREICAVVTRGTLTEGEMLSSNPDASYLMAITESCSLSVNQNDEITFGVCVVDVATNRIILGQFGDDLERSALACLLTALRPVEIIKPAKMLTSETERVILRHTRSPVVNELVPLLEFWNAEKTVCEIKKIYKQVNMPSVHESSNGPSVLCHKKDSLGSLPDILSELASAGESGNCALSALGGALFYLKQAFLDVTLLKFGKFELLPSSGFSDITQSQRPYMALDATALENLEIFENSRNGDSSGTLYAHLNHCVTAFGKRLLKTWLARPLYNLKSIKERQDAVASLKGVSLPIVLEFRRELSRLSDVERLFARLFASSEDSGRNANKVVLYEDAAKKQLLEFITALRGCEIMDQACFSLRAVLDHTKSDLLHYLLTPGKGIPDIQTILKHFKDAFDWVEASKSGRIIPHDGVDMEYDSACTAVKDIESSLKKHCKEQRKLLGDASINYVTVGKEAYLLEVPESLQGSIPRDYELRSSKKGFFRYWNPTIKKLLGELSQAESERESKLKSILQRLIVRFCEHHDRWRKLVSAIAELDVLISLAIASDFYEGPACCPVISGLSSSNEMPFCRAKSLGHPVLRSDSLGKGTFVPNDISIGGSGGSFILLTGPNMGGKSTLLRQICLAVILAQVGADVPAERFELSPVDRIFVRMGAKDHIMAGQSTFLTELSETACMLSSATTNSLVALDELGRGTSTSDGQAIAESVLEHFVHKVQCRGLFSTHYHRLAASYERDSKVSLCHMGCQVGKGDGAVDEVTFLYSLTPGACPKSYGVNVARLAGLPESVLKTAVAKSIEFEAAYGKHKQSENPLPIQAWEEEETRAFIQNFISIAAQISCHPPVDMGTGVLTELQRRARTLLSKA